MKTIGEAAVDYGNQITLKSTDNIGARHIAWRSFEAGIEFAHRWIDIKDELPKQEGLTGFSDIVLTKNINNHIMLERYFFEDNQFTSIRYDSDATHWRPIELI